MAPSSMPSSIASACAWSRSPKVPFSFDALERPAIEAQRLGDILEPIPCRRPVLVGNGGAEAQGGP